MLSPKNAFYLTVPYKPKSKTVYKIDYNRMRLRKAIERQKEEAILIGHIKEVWEYGENEAIPIKFASTLN